MDSKNRSKCTGGGFGKTMGIFSVKRNTTQIKNYNM